MSERDHHARTPGLAVSVAAAAGLALAIGCGPATAQNVVIDGDDIGGVVTGANGPEPGVWVIAQSTELPTKFARMVVTDDAGRYVIPDLPAANYEVWVRGYGLVDSPKLRAVPGDIMNLTAVKAPDEKSAAHYYPAIYWYSMIEIPDKAEFGANPDLPKDRTQADYLKQVKNIGCVGCHQLGQEATRTIPAGIGPYESGEEAWFRRIQSGQAGEGMANQMGNWNNTPLLRYAEWTDRIADGALPPTQPPRPAGVERNVVVSWWEWSQPDKYLHDLVSTDRRNPTVNAHGPLFGSPELSTDSLPILDPVANKVTYFDAPARDPDYFKPTPVAASSPYWGDEPLWDSKVSNHNDMFDAEGRLWLSAKFRGNDNPAYCQEGSDHPSAKVFPMKSSNRQITILDPATMKYTFIDTCFGSHHLQFGYDANDTLWMSGSGPVVGWIDTKKFLETGDAAASQGWAPYVVDTNGNGKVDAWTEPGKPTDPTKDVRLPGGNYAVMPNPADGSIWYTVGVFGGTPGFVRYDPATQLSEVYNVPMPTFGIRGGDIDSKGVVWGSASSGHLVSFDRSKCKGPLNGPTATGGQCPEGWSSYQYPGPGFAGLGDNSAESSYYTWVDQHNTLGLGNDVPVSTGNLNDAMLALVDGKFVVLRVPYPMGHYSKGLDGRIDDADAGWKGRGLWTASGDRTPWLKEGGKGTRPLAIHFQVRPDPLAH